MNNKQQEQWIENALNSLDNAQSAEPKPFLYTRLYAKMTNKKESVWDFYLQFLSKPAIAFASICVVIAVNVLVISNGYKQQSQTIVEEGQYATLNDNDDDVPSIFNDNENIEP